MPRRKNRTKAGSTANPSEPASAPPASRLVPLSEVVERTSLSEATLWRLRRANQFVPFRQISKRRIGVYEHELAAWMEARAVVDSNASTEELKVPAPEPASTSPSPPPAPRRRR
jgi:predicted DNA-binding transcriptional regulator AlpA